MLRWRKRKSQENFSRRKWRERGGEVLAEERSQRTDNTGLSKKDRGRFWLEKKGPPGRGEAKGRSYKDFRRYRIRSESEWRKSSGTQKGSLEKKTFTT